MEVLEASPEVDAADLLISDMRELLRHPWGRRLAYHIVHELSGIDERTFDPGIDDGASLALHMARSAGIREVGLALQSNLREADSTGYSLALVEGLSLAQQRAARNSKEDPE